MSEDAVPDEPIDELDNEFQIPEDRLQYWKAVPPGEALQVDLPRNAWDKLFAALEGPMFSEGIVIQIALATHHNDLDRVDELLKLWTNDFLSRRNEINRLKSAVISAGLRNRRKV